MKRIFLYIFLICIAGIFLLFFDPISRTVLGFGMTLHIIPDSPFRPLSLFTSAPHTYDTAIKLNDAILPVRIYQPSRNTQTAIVMYTPLIGEGNEDPRLISLAEAFARAGFTVATASSTTSEHQFMREQDVDSVVAVTKLVQETENITHIGMTGLSYGAGPAFVAASNPSIRDSVVLYAGFGGFFDLEHVLDFALTNKFSYKDIHKTVEPHVFIREGIELLEQQVGMDLEQYIETEEAEQFRKAVSPVETIDDIHIKKAYLVHPVQDTMIPYTESLRLHDALTERTIDVHMVLIEAIDHTGTFDLDMKNIVRHHIPLLFQLSTMFAEILTYR